MASPTHAIDLHGLANAPGYGAAKKALMKEGFWDEYGDIEPKEFQVNVEYSVRHEKTVTVKARSRQEAVELAANQVRDGFHDHDVEIDSTEVLE